MSRSSRNEYSCSIFFRLSIAGRVEAGTSSRTEANSASLARARYRMNSSSSRRQFCVLAEISTIWALHPDASLMFGQASRRSLREKTANVAGAALQSPQEPNFPPAHGSLARPFLEVRAARTRPDDEVGGPGSLFKRLVFGCSHSSPLENEAKPQLNLTRRIHSREYPAGVIGEITCRIFKDSVSVSSQSNRVLRITGDSEIRMIQEIECLGA